MLQDAKCPKCSHVFPVTQARKAFTVTCPRCEAELTAEFKKPSAAPEAGQPPYELQVKPGAVAETTTAPAKPRKRNDDDDEPKGAGSSVMIVLLSGGMGLLLVLGGLALTGWVLFTQIDMETPTVSNRSNNSNNNNNTKPNNSGNTGNNENKGNNGGNENNKGNNGGNSGGNKGGNKGNKGGNKGGEKLPPADPPPFVPPPVDPPPFDPPPFVPPAPPVKKETFKLEPAKGELTEIAPPANLANAPKTILLPGKAGHVAVGGGGRYIVMHFPQQGKLAVFDVNTAELTTENIENGEVALVAGANKCVTISGGKKGRIYSLPEMKKEEKEFEMPGPFGANGIAMGAATNGPVFMINPFGDVVLMDLATCKPVEGASQKITVPLAQVGQCRASHDGKLFLVGNGYNNRDKYLLVDEEQMKWRVRNPEAVSAYLSADGKLMYGKDQIVGSDSKVVASKPNILPHAWYVPAVTSTGDYFLCVTEIKIGAFPREKVLVQLTLHKDRNAAKPMKSWEGLPETEGMINTFFQASDPLDKHLFLIPEAKLLVILNHDKDKLVVRKLTIQ